MEYVIKELLHPEEDDEANFIYSELDSQRRETRRDPKRRAAGGYELQRH